MNLNNDQSEPIQAEASVRQQSAAPKNKNNFNKMFWLFFAIAFLIAFVAGGFFLGANKSNNPAAQVSVAPTATSTPDPTANWKTYAVTKEGIEFKYPPNFSVVNSIYDNELIPISFMDKSNTKQRLSTSPDIFIKVISVAQGDDFKTTLIKDVVFDGSGLNPKSFDEFSLKMIGENAVYYIKTGLFEGVLSMNYYLVNKNQIFAFNLTSSPVDWTNPNFNPENDALNKSLQQILSTFKFTN